MLRILLVVSAAMVPSSCGLAAVFRFHQENVLGTFAEFHIKSSSKVAADSVEAKALAEIDRLSQIYSTYDPNSEVRRWMAGRMGSNVSPELFELLKHCEQFQEQTNGAFNPRVASAISIWRDAAKKQKIPLPQSLVKAVEEIRQPAWKLDPKKRTATFVGGTDCRLSFDAVAKGMIVDKVSQITLRHPGVEGIVINIGGDLRVNGDISQRVLIGATEDEASMLGTLKLANRSVATSGGAYQFFEINGTRYSHIIDPRTATPVDHVASVTALADSTAAADALATALGVFTPTEAVA